MLYCIFCHFLLTLLWHLPPSCEGVCSWPDGEKYEGEWHDGVPNGLGSSIVQCGDRYYGEWRNGTRDGFGMLDCENLQYRGGFEAGSFSRYGKLVFGTNGESRYDGYFLEGKKWGWGYAEFETVRCRGCFCNDMPHGLFTESVLLEGSWYECQSQYLRGKLLWRKPRPEQVLDNEPGILAKHVHQKKLSYVRGNCSHEEGKFEFFDCIPQRSVRVINLGENRRYIGEVHIGEEKGKIDGLGIESFEMDDGTCELYAGRFCDGVRQGHGILLRGPGDFYTGSFQDGKPHGIGFDLTLESYYAGEMQVSPHAHINVQFNLAHSSQSGVRLYPGISLSLHSLMTQLLSFMTVWASAWFW